MRTYHPDLAYFRGYAYFDCDDGALLPWTTTKTGVDADSPIYKAVQREMIELTRPVVDFLSDLAKERSVAAAARPLENAINHARAKEVEAVTQQHAFVSPRPAPVPPGPRMQKIQYSKPLKEVEKARQILKVRSFTAVDLPPENCTSVNESSPGYKSPEEDRR